MTMMTNRLATNIGLTILLLLGAAETGWAQSYTIAPTPFQTALDNSGHIVSGACVWTYTAGTTTPATTYSDNAGTANSNPITADSAGRFTAYLIVGQTYKFTYESSCTPPAHGTTLRTQDNIAAVPASAANVDLTGTAGETISAGNCAYLSDGSGSKTAGQWFKCDSTNTYSSTTPEVGIVPSAIASGAHGTIRVAGSVTGLSSLSVGSEYFVSTAGAITSTAPTNKRHLGHADSATSLVVTGDPSTSFASVAPTMTNGQVIIGSTGTTPLIATLTAGTGFTVTNGAGTITLAPKVALLDSSMTEQDVVNTTTETAIYSFSIPANTLVAGKAVRLVLTGRAANNSGGAINVTLAVKLGATTLASGATSISSSTSNQPQALWCVINANNASASQRADAVWTSGGNLTEGAFGSATTVLTAYHGSAAVDMTGSQTLQVTVTWASAGASISFRRFLATVELIG